MQNTKILIIGNIGAGKTTLVNLIYQKLPTFHVIKIDQIRKAIGNGSFSKEYLAWSHFFDKIENIDSVIIEFTGVGPNKHAIRETLLRSKSTIYVIFLSTQLHICYQRNKSRTWDTPYPWHINPSEILTKLDKELQNDWNSGFWNPFHCFQSEENNKIINYLENELND